MQKLKEILLLSDLVHGAPTAAEGSGSNTPPVHFNFSPAHLSHSLPLSIAMLESSLKGV